MTDQFDWWRAALAAKQNHLEIPRLPATPEGQPDQPESGYFRKRTSRNGKPCWEAIAFYRNDDGAVLCRRQFGKVPTEPGALIELFAACTREPVDFKVYKAGRDGKGWPDELDAFGLPPIEEGPENERAVLGHNQPPEKTPADEALVRFDALERQFEEWVKQFPDIMQMDAVQGELMSRYIERARDLKQETEKKREELIAPLLKAQREINGVWNPIKDRIETFQRRVSSMWGTWRDAAQRRAQEVARKANEAAQRAAEEERKKRAVVDGEEAAPPPALQLVEPVKIKGAVGTRISQRTRNVAVIEDLPVLVTHMAKLENPPADLVKVAQAFANRFGAAGNLPGVRMEKQTYVA